MALVPGISRPLVATLALLVGGLAQAELVVNGGFETGTLGGWTQFGDTSSAGTGTSNPYNGSHVGVFSPHAAGGIFQTLNTVAGTTYDVQWWLRIDAGSPQDNLFAFNWDGGAAEYSLIDVNPGYGLFGFTLTAGSNATDLRFTFMNQDSSFSLDDVSVTVHDGRLPEPGSLALVALVLAGAGASARRRCQPG